MSGSSNDDQSGMSRTLLVTFLGAIVRRLNGWMPIGSAVSLMSGVGVDESSVRTAVFRLKKRGWLEPQKHGDTAGYALTDLAQRAFLDGDEFIWHARRPASLADGWCIVNVSVPESERARRHKLRTRLSGLGFGNLGSGVWIAPARMADAAVSAVDDIGVSSQAAIFVGNYAPGRPLPEVIGRAWDLPEINATYVDFIASHRPLEARLDDTAADPARAFRSYLEVVDRWRKLPFRDPGLPADLLSTDWQASTAGELFERLVSGLERPAVAFAESHWP